MLKRHLAVAVVSLAMAVWASVASLPATAAIMPAVIIVSGGDFSTAISPGSEQGWEFTTNSAVNVNALGVFDQGSNGLTDSHLVSLWDASDSSLITSATVLSTSTLSDGFRYLSISPVTLDSGGTFVISAFYSSSDDAVLSLAGITSVSEITVGGGKFDIGLGSSTFPTTSTGSAIFGPNFSVGPVAPVPLPSALPLFLSALAGLGFFGWRRRMKVGA